MSLIYVWCTIRIGPARLTFQPSYYVSLSVPIMTWPSSPKKKRRKINVQKRKNRGLFGSGDGGRGFLLRRSPSWGGGSSSSSTKLPRSGHPSPSPPFGFPVKVSKSGGAALSPETALIGHRFLRSTYPIAEANKTAAFHRPYSISTLLLCGVKCEPLVTFHFQCDQWPTYQLPRDTKQSHQILEHNRTTQF